MIPKVIHYCWFGGNSKPKLVRECIKSWKKYCPDYQIIEWNESNYDVTKNAYMREAYEAKKWGFVPDYARLDIIYEYGGIYLDTDVQVIKSYDTLLLNKAFVGIEKGNDCVVALGLGFGAEKGNIVIKSLLDSYESLHFCNNDGSLNLTPSPVLNSSVLERIGLIKKDELQYLGEITVYPSDFFSPRSWDNGLIEKTQNTYSIHRFAASWYTKAQQKNYRKKLKKMKRINLAADVKSVRQNHSMLYAMIYLVKHLKDY